MAGVEPPAATVALGAASTIPLVVVSVPGGEGRAMVLLGEGVVGQISLEAVQVEYEVMCLVLNPAGGRVRP